MNKLITAIIGICALTFGAVQTYAAEGVTVGGFVDAQWGFDDTNEGARVSSGEFSFTKTADGNTVVVEVPFVQTTSTSDFATGQNYGQAFVKHVYANGISWALGQWDGIFGLERNDATQILFSRHGAMFATQPKTNTGLLVGYKITEGMNVEAYVTGVKDEGGRDSGNKPEIGAKFSMTGDLNFGFGATIHEESPDVKRMYVNTTFGMNAGGVDFGAEVSYNKAGQGDAETSVGLIGSYPVMEAVTVAARVQSLSKVAGVFKATDLSVGPQYAFSKDFRVKADFNMVSTTATEGATAVTVKSGALAAVMSF